MNEDDIFGLVNDPDDVKIDEIIAENNIIDNDLHRKRVKSLLVVMRKHDIDNPKVFNKINIEFGGFPRSTAKSKLIVLALCWNKTVPSAGFGKYMPQYASTVRDLFQAGYMWKRDNNAPENSKEYTVVVDGKNVKCRTIYGVDEDKSDVFSNYIKITPAQVKKLKKDSKDPLTSDSDHMEIDHRMPIIRCKKQTVRPAYLWKKDYEDGSWIKNFQRISKKNNNIKARRCESAVYDGSRIEIPEAFMSMQEKGIFQMYCNDDDNCEYCFWANLDKIGEMIEDGLHRIENKTE